MLLAVIINTVILAMDGLFYDAKILAIFDDFNLNLTIFTIEMVFKIVADTPRRYIADKMKSRFRRSNYGHYQDLRVLVL